MNKRTGINISERIGINMSDMAGINIRGDGNYYE